MPSLIKKCKTFRWQPDSKSFPELPTITIWTRLVLGVLCGISLGLRMETKGVMGSLFGLNIITFLPMFWFNKFLDAQIDSYKSLNFAGVINSFCLMLLVWIIFFTAAHRDEEASLAKAISEAARASGGFATNDVVGEDIDGASAMKETGPDDEF